MSGAECQGSRSCSGANVVTHLPLLPAWKPANTRGRSSKTKKLMLCQIRRKNKAIKAVRLSKDIPEPVFDMNDQNRFFLVDRPSLT